MTEQSGAVRYPAVVALLRREREEAEIEAAHHDGGAQISQWGQNIAIHRKLAAERRELVCQIDAALAALAGEDGE